MMMEYFNLLVGLNSYLMIFSKIYIILVLLGYKDILHNKKFYISTIIVGTYTFVSFVLTENFIRTIILFLLVIIAIFYITKFDKIPKVKIIIISFICWICILLLDTIVFLIGTLITNSDVESSKELMFKNMFGNIIIILLFIAIFSNKRIQNICKNLSNLNIKNESKYMTGIVLLSVLLFSIMVYFCYFNTDRILMLIVVLISVIIYTIIVFGIIKEYEINVKIQSEYDILLKNLNEYENLLDLQRVTNHENKNQLLVIKGMVDKGESNTSEYINSIIDTQYKDNDAIIYKTNRIPSGGLRGLIY